MEIKIEFTSSYEAAITIDGKEMKYGIVPHKGYWGFISGPGLTIPDDNTIGGMVAIKLSRQLPDILQGHMPEEEYSPTGELWETWEKLSETAATQVYDRIDP